MSQSVTATAPAAITRTPLTLTWKCESFMPAACSSVNSACTIARPLATRPDGLIRSPSSDQNEAISEALCLFQAVANPSIRARTASSSPGAPPPACHPATPSPMHAIARTVSARFIDFSFFAARGCLSVPCVVLSIARKGRLGLDAVDQVQIDRWNSADAQVPLGEDVVPRRLVQLVQGLPQRRRGAQSGVALDEQVDVRPVRRAVDAELFGPVRQVETDPDPDSILFLPRDGEVQFRFKQVDLAHFPLGPAPDGLQPVHQGPELEGTQARRGLFPAVIARRAPHHHREPRRISLPVLYLGQGVSNKRELELVSVAPFEYN